MARSAAKAERWQRARQQEATEAAILRGSVDPRERDRAALIQEKQKVDSRAREIKTTLSQAKTRAALTGQYMPVTRYRALERELEEAKDKSQAARMLKVDFKTLHTKMKRYGITDSGDRDDEQP